jgi:hypothetical protein
MATVVMTTTVSAQQPAVSPAETKDVNLRACVELLRAYVRRRKARSSPS